MFHNCHVLYRLCGEARNYRRQSINASHRTPIIGRWCAGLEGQLSQVAAHVDTLTNAYQASTASVNKEATAEKFFTQRDKSVIHQRQSALHTKDQVTRVSKIARISKDQFEKQKDEIEGQLFELFKEKPAWKTADVAVRAPNCSNPNVF